MSACDVDGSVRIVLDRDRYSVTWRCPFCKTVAREEYAPDATNDLQREWGDS